MENERMAVGSEATHLLVQDRENVNDPCYVGTLTKRTISHRFQ